LVDDRRESIADQGLLEELVMGGILRVSFELIMSH
jgi:hypothetical protein